MSHSTVSLYSATSTIIVVHMHNSTTCGATAHWCHYHQQLKVRRDVTTAATRQACPIVALCPVLISVWRSIVLRAM